MMSLKSSTRSLFLVTATLKRFVAVFASVALLSSPVVANAEPCDSASEAYVDCLESELLHKTEQNEILQLRIGVKEEANGIMSADRERLQKALTDQQGILSSPQFWLGVGVVGGIVLTVLTWRRGGRSS
mgnify:FL=1